MTSERCDRSFFERPPDEVAHDLIGSLMVVHAIDHAVHARIVETEAYGGSEDPASHAFRGLTRRSAVMFGPAGVLYVYRSYGIHWCMNVVTEGAGTASAVLLRAAEICHVAEGGVVDYSHGVLLRGPGRLTRGLGISGADNGVDCRQEFGARVTFQGSPDDGGGNGTGCSRRIGISQGQERLSRYFLEGHPAVSRSPA
jgi:DNA-3-methyladenine glycosylase